LIPLWLRDRGGDAIGNRPETTADAEEEDDKPNPVAGA
jgi:hypothetical protein